LRGKKKQIRLKDPHFFEHQNHVGPSSGKEKVGDFRRRVHGSDVVGRLQVSLENFRVAKRNELQMVKERARESLVFFFCKAVVEFFIGGGGKKIRFKFKSPLTSLSLFSPSIAARNRPFSRIARLFYSFASLYFGTRDVEVQTERRKFSSSGGILFFFFFP